MPKGTGSLETAYVEFVFRVHADGRRERTPTVYARDGAGTIRPVRGMLNGKVGEFVADAVAEAIELGEPGGGTRRVQIDERQFPGREGTA